MISEKIRTAQGMEGARRATGIPCAATAAPGVHSMPSLPLNPPDPEIPEKAVRRRFTAEYKLTFSNRPSLPGGRRHWRPSCAGKAFTPLTLTTWRRQREIWHAFGAGPQTGGGRLRPQSLQPEVDRLRKEPIGSKSV